MSRSSLRKPFFPKNSIVEKIVVTVRDKFVIIFFCLYFILGIVIYRDYGVAWDEPFQDNIGKVNLEYILDGNRVLLSELYSDRDHGPLYEILLVGFGRIIGVYDQEFFIVGQSTIFFRHFVNFSTFFIGVVFFYRLCKQRFRNSKIALLGATFLILTPRIFADAFYNSKDTVLLTLFIITIYALLKFLEKRTIKSLIVLALLTAVSIDIRIAAIFIPIFAIILYLLSLIFSRETRKSYIRDGLLLLLYLVGTASLVVLMWPFLWEDPLNNFFYAWERSSHYVQDVKNLYLGGPAFARSLPWHYIPVWILISTPPIYIFLFFIGLVSLLVSLVKSVKTFVKNQSIDILFLFWFFIPIFMVIVFNSTLYNAWRHLFFIYPAFLLIALHGAVGIERFAQRLTKNPNIIRFLYLLLIFNLLYIAFVMTKSHPYQHIYFNFLAGRDMEKVRDKFETDYWGLSYRKGLEYILENDKSEVITLMTETPPGKYNSEALPDFEKSRLKYVYSEDEKPKYFLTTFFNSRDEPPYEEIYSVKIRGAKIMSVYKL